MPKLETIRAKIGAGILDIFRPGWAGDVNLETLDLSDCEVCVLGQVFGGFDTGADRLFALRAEVEGETGKYNATEAAGFSIGPHERNMKYSQLTKSWKREIAKRQGA